MTVDAGVWVSLSVYFVLMIAIGIYAYKKQAKDTQGYLLGGRDLSPSVTALSAGASDMSGWLLVGLPGAMYASGLINVWMALGLVVGAGLNYWLVAPRLRTYTEVAGDAITLPDYFANRFDAKSPLLRVISALIVIVFFTVYTAANLVGGGKLFESALAMDYTTGVYITALVVVGYTLIGGFLAVSLTDFVQGIMMLVAMLVVPYVAMNHLGGLDVTMAAVRELDPNLMNPLHGASVLGVVSMLAWGLGYFGQPHIIVRFMAMRSAKDAPMAGLIGMGWMVLSLLGALFVGFAGIAYVENTHMPLDDPETIFLVFTQYLFHPLVSGFLLAAILAAIMSTISSQLLVVSSSLTKDIYTLFFNKHASEARQVLVGRVSVLVVAAIACVLAQDADSSVLGLVANAWAGFGAAFGPLVLFSLLWRRMSETGAILGMVTGALVVIVWAYVPIGGVLLNDHLYAMVPAFVLSCIATILGSLMHPARASTTDQFDEFARRLR